MLFLADGAFRRVKTKSARRLKLNRSTVASGLADSNLPPSESFCILFGAQRGEIVNELWKFASPSKFVAE